MSPMLTLGDILFLVPFLLRAEHPTPSQRIIFFPLGTSGKNRKHAGLPRMNCFSDKNLTLLPPISITQDPGLLYSVIS